MIRNVVMVKLLPDADPEWAQGIRRRLSALDCGGPAYTTGPDLGLREGNWSFAIVADFPDEAAYRAYDLDEEHNAIRAELAPRCEQIARLQFEV